MDRRCISIVCGVGGAAFMTLLASAENIKNYLVGTAVVWLVAGTALAMCWAYEHFCHNQGGKDE